MNRTPQAIKYPLGGYYNLPVFVLLVLLHTSTFSRASFQTCSAQFELAKYDSALACFDQIARDTPASKENFYNRGMCYYQLKKYAAAIQDFNTSLSLDSNFKEAQWMLALSLEQSGNTHNAVTIYRMLNTKYGGYNDSKKRVFYYRLSVLISENWYYMLAIMFMVIIVVTVIAKTVTYKRG